MRPSRREFVKSVTASGIVLSLSRLGWAEEPGIRRARDAAGTTTLEPGRHRRRPHRRRRQGHRRQALRVRFPRRRSSGLAGEDLARHARPRAGRHARLHRHRPGAPERRAQALGGGDRGRSGAGRHPRSRILCRRPVLPGRQDAALSRPAGGAADLRDVRRLRSGAARAARRNVREVRRGDRPRRDAELRRLSLHARRRADARRARCLFAAAGRLGQPGTLRRTRRCRSGRRSPTDTGAPTPRPRPMASRSAPSLPRTIRPCWCSTANSRRNPSIRCFSSRKAVSPGTTRAARTSNSCSACSRLTRPRRRSRSCSARRARRSSRRASTPSSPIWAAASAAATIRRSRSMSRWRRCSFPAVRSGWRTTAISSSRAASSGTPSRCARGSAIDRATGKIQAFAADHVLDGGGLANLSANVATVGATAAIGIYDIPKVDVTTVALHSRGVTAGSMRGYGTLQTMTALEVLIDEAAAALAARPDRVPAAQCAQDRRPDHDRKSVQRLGAHAGDSGQAREASDLAAARRGESARAADRHARRHRRGLRHQGLRHRRGLLAGARWKSIREGRIAIHCDHVEMGNGIGTALANRVALHIWAASPTKSRSRGSTRSAALALVTSGDPYTMDQATQNAAQRNPRWVPAISTATTASIGAHVGTHAAAEAARVIFRFGLWPAALELWGIAPTDPTGEAMGGGDAGRTGSSSCRACRRCRCRRSPPGRMRAIS